MAPCGAHYENAALNSEPRELLRPSPICSQKLPANNGAAIKNTAIRNIVYLSKGRRRRIENC